MKGFLLGLVLLVLLSLGASIYVALGRIAWEGSYRTVAVVVSYQDLGELGIEVTESLLEGLANLGVTGLALPLPLPSTGELGLELESGSEIEELRRLGLEPVPLLPLSRLKRDGDGGLEVYSAELARLQPRIILFEWGERDYPPEWLEGEELIRAFQDHRPLVGLMEFEPEPGEFLYRHGFSDFVRAHRIKPEEMEELTLTETLLRFRRAVRERNIRLLLIHLFNTPLEENLDYLERLTALLREDGFQLGLPEPPPDFVVAEPILVLILLGPLGLLLLGLNRAWARQLNLSLNLFLLLAGGITIVLGLSIAKGPFRLASAWGVATFTPVAAYLLLGLEPDLIRGRQGEVEVGVASLGRGVVTVLAFSGIVLLGGLWVGTVLSGREFFLKLEQFRGVKAALIFPLILVLALHFSRHGFSELKRFLLRQPMIGELLLLLFGLGAVAIILLRSENFSIIPVTELEERSRGLLEGVLYARPRFKEFLLGHPLLFLWGAYGYGRRLGDYAPFGLVIGLIGQVSIINSFAHLHTPFLLSLLRTANGLLLGLIVGLALFGLVRWGERVWRRGS